MHEKPPMRPLWADWTVMTRFTAPRPHSVDQERVGGPRGERELIHVEGPSLIRIDKL